MDDWESSIQEAAGQRLDRGDIMPGRPRHVALHQVTYRYPEADHDILHEVDFEVRQGENRRCGGRERLPASMRPALAASGLEFKVKMHDLRHAHASWLLAGGADLQVVKERLLHGSIPTTEKYLHTLPDADETALDALASTRADRKMIRLSQSAVANPGQG
ncbi:tyrosine-type recombinase/integrase [Planotetraspora sp. A-T 1434]|uniref:tyrosine-type recombinase/integrase n=1 Tax=Planotetraspora sp. A-T 1434 TaxID=2979219 RepID=UPI0021C1F1DA|nr:tyrosine-type recombinase/integrase [Planotetraspora sp. A-T 1434]MCT9935210.1 tyrosine-type recombinase/integrase [Planotetraspora sp. A-T 1434]